MSILVATIIILSSFPIFSSLMKSTTSSKPICWSILQIHLILESPTRIHVAFLRVMIFYMSLLFPISIYDNLLYLSIFICSFIFTDLFILFLSNHLSAIILFKPSLSLFYLLLTLIHEINGHFHFI
jgi:hypothetical protein